MLLSGGVSRCFAKRVFIKEHAKLLYVEWAAFSLSLSFVIISFSKGSQILEAQSTIGKTILVLQASNQKAGVDHFEALEKEQFLVWVSRNVVNVF